MLFLQSHPTPEQHKMREEDHTNWFSRWEDQLPSPEELTPLTQSLITPDLALAFDITPNPTPPISNPSPHPLPPPPSSQPTSNSAEFADSAEMTPGGAGPDEPARTLKRPRLVWTPQLHKRFVDAVAHLGIKNAVPKTIMQLMSVDGLTRENVASHLQKYRLYLKRMQGLSAGGGAAGAGGGIGTDAATEHLFASAPVPHHFLHRGGGGPVMPPTAAAGGGGEHYLPQFVPVAALHHQHHMAAAAAVAAAAQQQQFQQHQRHMGHFGSPPGGQFEHHGFLARQPQAVHRMVGPAAVPGPAPPGPVYVEDLESGGAGGTRKVLTLFPTGED